MGVVPIWNIVTRSKESCGAQKALDLNIRVARK